MAIATSGPKWRSSGVSASGYSRSVTKLVNPGVTSAFEPGSVDGFAPQQRFPDQLGIGLGVEHGLEEFSSQSRARPAGPWCRKLVSLMRDLRSESL